MLGGIVMERPLSILLIEDEPLECQEIIKSIESTTGVELTGVTNNILKALEYVKDTQPDAIILDLELHKGYGNGLAFLDSLREMRLDFPIYILVTTNNVSFVTHEGARERGADFIMLKRQADYSAKSVIEMLSSLKNIIQSNKRNITYLNNSDSQEKKEQRITNRILTEFDRVGIPTNAVGRQYLIDGIMLIINGYTQKIYETISTKRAKTEGSVERAMQNAIAKAWKTTLIDDLEKYYTARIHSTKGAPTVMEFIHYYAGKLNNDY